MADAAKEVRVKITGDDRELGAASNRSVGKLNELKSAAGSIAGSLIGGVIGGGIVGAVTTLVDKVAAQITAARALVLDARSQDLDKQFLRGARGYSSAITGGKDDAVVERAIANARQARAEAEAGDEGAAANFERMGIALKEISGLNPADLFERIWRAFEHGATTAGKEGAVGVLGSSEANSLVPHMVGGRQRLPFGNIRGAFGDVMLANSGLYAMQMREQLTKPGEWKADMEPFARYGTGRDATAKRLQEGARQAILAVQREELSGEAKLADIAKERLRLLALIRAERDPVKQAQLIQRDVDLEQAANATGREMAKAAGSSAGNTLPGVLPNTDEFAKLGLFVGGGGASPVMQLQQALSTRLDILIRNAEGQRADNNENFR